MVRRFVRLKTQESHTDLHKTIRQALLENGYFERSPKRGRAVFAKKRSGDPDPRNRTHELRVSAQGYHGGTAVTVEIVTPAGTTQRDAELLETHVRAMLLPQLRESLVLYSGMVSEDGRHIEFRDEAPPFSFGPVPNRLPDRSTAAKVIFLVDAALFGGLAALYTYLILVGEVEDRLAPFILGVFGLFASLGIGGLLYRRYSRRLPAFVLATLQGVELINEKGGTTSISWDRFQTVSQATSEWRLYWNDGEATRWAKVSRKIASEVWNALQVSQRTKSLGTMTTLAAFNLVDPGSSVVVAERGLTDEELAYRKLSRRWLPSGRLIPVYVTREEDEGLVRRFVEKHALEVQDLKMVALTAVEQQSWSLAIDLLRRAADLKPDDDEIAYHLAGSLMKDGKLSEGLEIADAYLKIHSDASRVHVIRALITSKLGRLEEALHHIGRAADLDPNNVEALNVWYDVVTGEAGVGQANSELDFFASKHPTSWAAHIVLGQRMLAAGDQEEGLHRLRQALDISANDDTLYARSSALQSTGRTDESIRLLEDYSTKRDLGPGALWCLAAGYAKRGEPEKALSVLDKITPEMGGAAVAAADRLRQQITKGFQPS